jgi:hypothetical protein
MKTRFQNLFYLEKALNKLNIVNKQQEKINTELNSYNANLIYPNQTGMILNLLGMVKNMS